MPQRAPEDAEVVRHEERRDGDRDDVVEHLAPGGEERPELVERVAGERGRAAGLGVHRRALGVGGGGRGEDQPRNQEHDRRHPKRVDRDEAERVVDRAAHVAVGGAEEGARPEDALQPLVLRPPFRHAGRKLQAAEGGQTRKGMISSATMFATLIMGLIAGPAVSL